MKKLTIAVALVASLSLGGCANLGPAFQVLTGSLATTAPVTVTTAEKALTVAHLALNTIAQDILAATQAGVLHGSAATTVKSYYDRADDALRAADQLDKVANATGVMSKVDEADALITQIHDLVPAK